jgi:hypothetical protein
MSQELGIESNSLFSCLRKSQQYNGEFPSVEDYMKEDGHEVSGRDGAAHRYLR